MLTTTILARISALAAVAAAVAVASAAEGAEFANAAFPGQNGKLAYMFQQAIWVANPDGSGAVQLTASGGNNRSPRWSPDGARIAFASGRASPSSIFVMNADGSGQRQVTFGSARDRLSTWTADGTQIVYDKEFREIYAINAEGSGGERRLTDGLMPSVSPYGNKLAFSGLGGGLFTMNLDGSENLQIVPDGTTDFSPTWSPGGTDLLFTRFVGEVRDIFRVHANGLGLVQLTNTPGRSEVGPVWSRTERRSRSRGVRLPSAAPRAESSRSTATGAARVKSRG